MALLNPYAPLFVPAAETAPVTPSPAFFFWPFCYDYSYFYSDALPQPTFPFHCGSLPADVLHSTPTLVPGPAHHLPNCCYDYYCCYDHETGFNPGFPLPWPTHTLVGVAVPPLAPSDVISLPFHPPFPIAQEDLLAPLPAWHPPIQPVQREILEPPSMPLPKSKKPSGKSPRRAVVLRKRVKVGPRCRFTVLNVNATEVVGGGRAHRCPRRSGHSGMKTSWMPRLRRYRSRSPEEVKLYEKCQFKTGGLFEGSSGRLAGDGSSDARTTVMIKNVPNILRKETLLGLLDRHCRMENSRVATTCGQQQQGGESQFIPSRFDFFYLPMDFGTGCNLGYAFVNFTSAAAAWRLYHAFDNRSWELFGSTKVCRITYARVQGLGALLKHFRNTSFRCDRDELLPVYFVPHRDGTFQGRSHYVGRRMSALRYDRRS